MAREDWNSRRTPWPCPESHPPRVTRSGHGDAWGEGHLILIITSAGTIEMLEMPRAENRYSGFIWIDHYQSFLDGKRSSGDYPRSIYRLSCSPEYRY